MWEAQQDRLNVYLTGVARQSAALVTETTIKRWVSATFLNGN